MQFRILPVAVAVLAVVVVVLAVDQPDTVDALHSRCGSHGRHGWVAENEEVDKEAMKTAFPSNYEAMGWMKYKSGKCTYKGAYAECPGKHHWHHGEHHWDKHYGFGKLYHPCSLSSDCCSHNCQPASSGSICCPMGTVGLGGNCTVATCCKGTCKNETNVFTCRA